MIHALLTGLAVSRLTAALDHHDKTIESYFAPSFAVSLCTLPLYPVLAGKLGLFAISALNSALVAIIIAFVLVYLSWRAILAIIVGVPLLLLIAMIGGAMLIEQRIDRGWRELAPHAVVPPPHGDVSSPLSNATITSLNAYLASQLARGDDLIDPLPQEVVWFLVAHRSDIDALRQRSPGTSDPLARLRMQKVLLVDALQVGSWADVEAARRLTESMLRQPNFNEVLYAITAAENQLGVMRKLDPHYGVSIPSFDPHQMLIDAIAAQDARILKLSAPWYARPYARLCAAESAYSGLRQAMIIHNLRGCRFDAPRDLDAKPRVPFNPTGVLSEGAWLAARANRLVLDREGTERVLAAKSGGQPPATGECSDRKWILEGNVLRLEPPLPATAPALPTRHEFSARLVARSTS